MRTYGTPQVSAATRRSRATTTIGGTSGPAHASTIRARNATACADVARRAQRSNTARSSTDNNNGSSFGPRRGAGTPEETLIQELTMDLRRRTLVSCAANDDSKLVP
jgi:hypothetical protein